MWHPALFLVGPRATGKTTTAARFAATVVHLDREAEAAAFRADPDASLALLPEPVLLDEWQVVPGTLGAVKRTVREQRHAIAGPTFLDRVVGGADLAPAADSPTLAGYIDLALRGGFPEPALRLDGTARTRWLDSYVDHLLTRDAALVDVPRDPVRLRRYFEACAVNTAGVVDEGTLLEAAGINRRTANAYDRVLTNLLVIDALPAWTSNRLKRLVM